MKKVFTCAFTMLIAGTLFARELTPSEALSNAMEQLNAGKATKRKSVAWQTVTNVMTLSYTETDDGGTPLFYVYDMPEGGFIIAGADSRAHALLGYTDNGSFTHSKQNVAFNSWMTNCTETLKQLSKKADVSVESKHRTTTLTTSVSPLLGGIMWDQEHPYNMSCPKVSNEKGASVLPPTGCVATAMAQIMMYYKWPKTGEGTNTNELFETQTVDFSKSVYDWDNMLDTYTGYETADDIHAKAVAKLMSDAGCSVNMQYEEGGSGAFSTDAAQALAKHFKYNKGIYCAYRYQFATDDWNALLRNELDNARPVYFSASTSAGPGHAFIIDGYDTNGLYHVNWGWGGYCNGYFDINYLNYTQQGTNINADNFNSTQYAITGIMPDENGTSQYKTHLWLREEIQYDKEEQLFSFRFVNEGLCSFNGETGILIYDANNNLLARKSIQIDEPIPCTGEFGGTIGIPTDIKWAKGYRVVPYYSDSAGGEAKEFESLLNGARYLVLNDENGELVWTDPEKLSAVLTCSDVKLLRAYVGYAPKFSVTVTNDKNATKEYNEEVYVYIYDSEGTPICLGYTQVFMAPGETKTVEVECFFDMEGNYSYTNLKTGVQYVREVSYCRGGYGIPLVENATFKMEKKTRSNITYSDFAIDKTEVKRGENLTASFNAKNAGGFDNIKYIFFIVQEGDEQNVVAQSEAETDIHANTTTKVNLYKYIDLAPGKYYGLFCKAGNAGNSYLVTDRYYFTVTDEQTAIDEVGDKKRQDIIYDLQGRRVKQMKKGGIYVVNGKKTVR